MWHWVTEWGGCEKLSNSKSFLNTQWTQANRKLNVLWTGHTSESMCLCCAVTRLPPCFPKHARTLHMLAYDANEWCLQPPLLRFQMILCWKPWSFYCAKFSAFIETSWFNYIKQRLFLFSHHRSSVSSSEPIFELHCPRLFDFSNCYLI